MKQKTKKILWSATAGAALILAPIASSVIASTHEMAAENDPFWTLFAHMSTPSDTTACLAAAQNYVDTHTYSSDGEKQGELAALNQTCVEVANMPAEMQSQMAAEGVRTNLFFQSDWHNISDLYFTKQDGATVIINSKIAPKVVAPNLVGKIQFTHTLDFMTYDFWTFMINFQDMVNVQEGYIGFNASMVESMKNYGAQLTMYGLDFTQVPDIYVTGANGVTMHKATSNDISGLSYDSATGQLTFDASHFSAFRAVEKGSKVASMKISKVTPNKVKYNSKKSSFKITVKGKGLYKKGTSTTCTMGFQQAAKMKASRNGKKVVCTFGMSSFRILGYYPVTITLAGVGEVSKTNAVRVR